MGSGINREVMLIRRDLSTALLSSEWDLQALSLGIPQRHEYCVRIYATILFVFRASGCRPTLKVEVLLYLGT